MSTMTKVFVVLTSVLTITVSTLFVAAAAQWINWKDLADGFRTARDAAVTERQNSQATAVMALQVKDDAIAERERTVSDLNQKLQTNADENARLKSESSRFQSEALSAEGSRKSLESMLAVEKSARDRAEEHNNELRRDNMELQTRNTRLNGRNMELVSQTTVLRDEVRNLQEKNYALEQRFAQVQRGGAAGAGIDQTTEAGTARVVSPSVKGVIDATVTSVDGNYASISVGESSGVAPGMEFMLVRDGSYLGDLLIDTVRPKEAGGKLVLAAGREVQAGDLARYGLEGK